MCDHKHRTWQTPSNRTGHLNLICLDCDVPLNTKFFGLACGSSSESWRDDLSELTDFSNRATYGDLEPDEVW